MRDSGPPAEPVGSAGTRCRVGCAGCEVLRSPTCPDASSALENCPDALARGGRRARDCNNWPVFASLRLAAASAWPLRWGLSDWLGEPRKLDDMDEWQMRWLHGAAVGGAGWGRICASRASSAITFTSAFLATAEARARFEWAALASPLTRRRCHPRGSRGRRQCPDLSGIQPPISRP
jgi:hypothetical protein